MKYRNGILTTGVVLLLFMSLLRISGQEDKTHFSRVFGCLKDFRIFLPADYYTSLKRYPVIYYFHGNTGSHKLDIKGVDSLVKKNDVILVAWNGRSVDQDLRPYNIGNHSNIKYNVQFKDYFPELVSYIDSTYRTLRNRSDRAIIGHSMGGFMSFFLAGKYPDLVGTAFNSKGSPEFFVGYPAQHTLYHMRYMFMNLGGVRLGFSSSEECELHNLNNEVVQGALRERDLDFTAFNYPGGHAITPGQFADAFNFVIASIRNPLPEPIRWHHADLYPAFDIRGYEVRSNLSARGFIELKGVTKTGFGICTKAWEPDGVIIPNVTITVRTPALYRPGTKYKLLDYNETTDSLNTLDVLSDDGGRITCQVNSEHHQIGIWQQGGPPEITLASYNVSGSGLFLDQKEGNHVRIRLLNRGGSDTKGISVRLSTSVPGILIGNPVIDLKTLRSGELSWLPVGFTVDAASKPPKDGSPFRIRFNLTITDKYNHVWEDEFDAPVYFDVTEFTNIGIDDGDSEVFGSGDGNNIADPGETVMIYEISNGSHRLRLYYDDPYVDDERLYDEIQPDKWGDGYSLSSLIHISSRCPAGHKIRFLSCYEIKDWKTIRRDVTWGTFTITVGGTRE